MPFDPLSLFPYMDAIKFGVSQAKAYAERGAILDAIRDYIKTNNVLTDRQRVRLYRHFQQNDDLRAAILQAKDEREVHEILDSYSTPREPYSLLKQRIGEIFIAQHVKFNDNVIASQTLYNVNRTHKLVGTVRDELQVLTAELGIVKDFRAIYERDFLALLEYANSAFVRVNTDPIGAMVDFASTALASQGLEEITISLDERVVKTKRYKPSTMNIITRGSTTEKMMKLMADWESGNLYHCVLDDSDDFDFSVVEYGPPSGMGDRKPVRLEFYSPPVEIERQITLATGNTTCTLQAKIRVDRVHGVTTIVPLDSDPAVNFCIKYDTNAHSANLTINMKFDAHRPQTRSLPLLRVFAALNPDDNLTLTDNESEIEFSVFEMKKWADKDDLLEIADYADFAKTFLDADTWLQTKNLIADPLPWPIQGNIAKARSVLERIVPVLKHGQTQAALTTTATFDTFSDEAKNMQIVEGKVSRNFIRWSGQFHINGTYICTEQITYTEPRVEISQNGTRVDAQTLEEAQAKCPGPLTLTFSHEEAHVAYSRNEKHAAP